MESHIGTVSTPPKGKKSTRKPESMPYDHKTERPEYYSRVALSTRIRSTYELVLKVICIQENMYSLWENSN